MAIAEGFVLAERLNILRNHNSTSPLGATGSCRAVHAALFEAMRQHAS
jgi:hypothetical protein